MREEDSNWFSKWEDELPSPDELTPLSQTLISRDLAMAFDIQPSSNFSGGGHQFPMNRRAPPPLGPTHHPISGDFDSSGGSEEPARTLKRPRLVWTPQLHKRFVDAVAHLGIKNAVPKTIMQLMSVDGLTRENVASHLQKYRLYLKRMQGINNGGVAGGGGSAGGGSGDPATDHLFASSPVPAHFLHPQGSGGGGGYVSPVNSLHHPHQVAAMVVGGTYHHHHNHHRQMGHFQNSFLSRQAQLGGARLGVTVSSGGIGGGGGGGEDLDSGASGRKVLTLFPSIDD